MIQDKQKFLIRVAGVLLVLMVIARFDLLPGQSEPPETRFLGEWSIDPMKTLQEAETDRKVVQQNYAAVGKIMGQFGYQFTQAGGVKFGRAKRYRDIGTFTVTRIGKSNVRLAIKYTDARAGQSDALDLSYAKDGLVLKRGQHITVLSR